MRAFHLAAQTGESCRPVQLLAALCELDGPIGAALRRPDGGPLIARPVDPRPMHGGGHASYLAMQTQTAAAQFASERGETLSPQHLLVAIIDQGEAETIAQLDDASIAVAGIRSGTPDLGLGRAVKPRIPSSLENR